MAIGTYISIVALNVNRLNVPTERHRVAEWIQKQDPYICCLQETYLRPQDTYRLKVSRWKYIFHANGKEKKAGTAVLISYKIDVKIKKITRDKEGLYIIIKRSINARGRHNNCKYLSTQHRSTSIHKTNTNRHKRRNWQYHNNSRRL